MAHEGYRMESKLEIKPNQVKPWFQNAQSRDTWRMQDTDGRSKRRSSLIRLNHGFRTHKVETHDTRRIQMGDQNGGQALQNGGQA